MTTTPWRFWIDRGGTFTDCIGLDPSDGTVRVAKVLSGDDAPLHGIRALLDLAPSAPIPPCELRMGTTLGTNALLERGGVRCALVITRGLEDLLEIGDQSRPDLFALHIERPPVLHTDTVPTAARLDPSGQLLAPHNPAALAPALRRAHARGCRSLAVVVMHAYRDGTQERAIAALARDIGFDHVSCSHEVAEQVGIVGRGDTTVVDAYLTPLLRDYLEGLRVALPGSSIAVMCSDGSLVPSTRFRGRDAVLSGPAGGAVACAQLAQRHGHSAVIGFDMGGTSTDVARIGQSLPRTYETRVAGVRLRTPMLDIHTVAAGGGSLCRIEHGRFTVGPASAGADPGPLCYGRPHADALALTDIHLRLGRLSDDRFVFPLDLPPVEAALEALRAQLPTAWATRDTRSIAEGFFEVAVQNMAAAIRQVSVAQGHDARDHALVVFGGAGGQAACSVARRLGIAEVLVPPLPGALSAWGMGLAPLAWRSEADLGRTPLRAATTWTAAQHALSRLREQGHRTVEADGIPRTAHEVLAWIDLRYAGTQHSLSIQLPLDDDGITQTEAEAEAAFADLHRRQLGYDRPDHPVEAVTLRVQVRGHLVAPPAPAIPAADTLPPALRTTSLWCDGQAHDAPVYEREALGRGPQLPGPALVLEDTATVVVEPGWTLHVADDGSLCLRDRAGPRRTTLGTACDPVQLEIFANRFMAIAQQMGVVLRRTALSTNIRERLDFSCAVFDRAGALVANAPHMPVHLGAMGESVAAIAAQHPDPRPGDVFATNDPAAGGSHLPDITVVTPVHIDGALAFYVASRGHHSDVGGITPGSMPPHSTSLAQEGVVFRGQPIVRAGVLDAPGILRTLTDAEFPARRPEENLADLQAQIAANHRGALLLCELCEQVGHPVVAAYMQHVQDNAARAVGDAIARLPDGTHRYVDHTDDGVPIAVTLRVDGSRAVIDFAGTGAAVPGNLNAPRAVAVAAVLYVLRCLVGEPIPLNRGCLRPIELHIEPGSLLDPPPDAAVAGGNVETAQRVVDVLLAAVGSSAASQGTMNNVTFGDEGFGYYETIGGGEGASEGRPGTDGVHTHMTNTRITDPEVLEARFPVRLRRFAIRRGSGGAGAARGGDGLVREYTLLRPLTVSILSDRRRHAPFGLAGGEPGQIGRNLFCADPEAADPPRVLAARDSVKAPAGAQLTIETPGGGGFGPPPVADDE